MPLCGRSVQPTPACAAACLYACRLSRTEESILKSVLTMQAVHLLTGRSGTG